MAWVTFILLLTIVAFATPGARAAPMSVVASTDRLTLDYKLEFQTNLTRTMPIVSVLVDKTNSSASIAAVTGPFDRALQKLVPGASLDPLSFRFAAKTEVLNSTTGMWRLQENITSSILGIRTDPGALVSYNLEFLPMNVSDPVRLANVEFNHIGETYLLQPLQSLSASQTPPDAYFFNNARYTTSFVPEILTRKFDLLDFTWVSPLPQWSSGTPNLGSDSSWDFDPSTMRAAGVPFNLTLATHPVENTYLNFIVEKYTPRVELTAPPRTSADQSTISFQLASPFEIVMPIIIGVSAGIGLVAYVVERRALRSGATKTSRRRR